MCLSLSLHALAEELSVEYEVRDAGGKHSGGHSVAGQAGPHRGLPGNGTRGASAIHVQCNPGHGNVPGGPDGPALTVDRLVVSIILVARVQSQANSTRQSHEM